MHFCTLQEHGKDEIVQAIFRHARFRRTCLFDLHVLVHLFLSNEFLPYRKSF